MDESTYGESALRPMKKKKKKRISNLRYKRNLFFTQIWQITIFSSISVYLSMFFINRSMEPISSKDIDIQGEKLLSKANIIKAMQLKLPISILEVNPKEVEKKLIAKLPIKAVSINRRLMPPGIDIMILERKPIASALKVGTAGQERGMIDKEGNWIPLFNSKKSSLELKPLIIDGWTKGNKDTISFILKYQDKLDLSLKRIIFAPDGNISLQSQDFLFIHLGNQPSVLGQQLEVITHLSKNLQNELNNEEETVLDLRNPSKPKLFRGNKSDKLKK